LQKERSRRNELEADAAELQEKMDKLRKTIADHDEKLK